MPNTWLELEEAPPETKAATSPFKVIVFELFFGTIKDEVEPRLKTTSPVVAEEIVMLTGPASNAPASSNNWRLLKEEMPAEFPPPIVSLNVMSVTRTSSVLFAASFIRYKTLPVDSMTTWRAATLFESVVRVKVDPEEMTMFWPATSVVEIATPPLFTVIELFELEPTAVAPERSKVDVCVAAEDDVKMSP
jgi:hypothetical protein